MHRPPLPPPSKITFWLCGCMERWRRFTDYIIDVPFTFLASLTCKGRVLSNSKLISYVLREGTQKHRQHFGGLVNEEWAKRTRKSRHFCVTCFFPYSFHYSVIPFSFVPPRPFSLSSLLSFLILFIYLFIYLFLLFPCLRKRT